MLAKILWLCEATCSQRFGGGLFPGEMLLYNLSALLASGMIDYFI